MKPKIIVYLIKLKISLNKNKKKKAKILAFFFSFMRKKLIGKNVKKRKKSYIFCQFTDKNTQK